MKAPRVPDASLNAVVVGDSQEADAVSHGLLKGGYRVVQVVERAEEDFQIEAPLLHLADCRFLTKEIVKTYGEPHILLYARQPEVCLPFAKVSAADWRDVVGRTMKPAFHCCQAFGERMLRKGSGHIVLLSSVAGSVGIAETSTISVASGAIEQLVRTLGAEWAARGVRVNGIAHWSMFLRESGIVPVDPGWSCGRLPSLEALVDAVRFLVSDAASGVSGEILKLDAGYSAQ